MQSQFTPQPQQQQQQQQPPQVPGQPPLPQQRQMSMGPQSVPGPIPPPQPPRSVTPKQMYPDPSPPVNLRSVIPDKTTNKKVIIPVNKPNIQVDTFEIFDISSDEVKDIPFSTLYTPQSRFQIPSFLPDGINMEDIFYNREGYILVRIEQEKYKLKQKIESLGDDNDEEKQNWNPN